MKREDVKNKIPGITDEQLECGLNILEKAIQTCLK